MNEKLSSKRRKEIKAKMVAALSERLESLSAGYREILLDDLVTAFESRFAVLYRADCLEIGVVARRSVEVELV